MLSEEQLHFGDFKFDLQQRLLLREGQVVPLSPKVLRTLELLLEADGGLVSKEVFMQALWPDTFVEESNLTQNIFVLRKTLGLTVAGAHYLVTIPKRGYRLTVAVASVQQASLSAVLAIAAPATTAQEPAPGDGMAVSEQAGVPLAEPARESPVLEKTAPQQNSQKTYSGVLARLWPWAAAALVLCNLVTGVALFRGHQTNEPVHII